MKYKIIDEVDGRVNIFCYYEDGTYMNLNLIGNRDINDILKDAYIISSNPMNRSLFEGELPADLIEFEANSVPTILKVNDFENTSATIYDQYGSPMELEVEFTVEGTDKARFENGKLIEDGVEMDTSFFIVAKYGELEERVERTLFAPIPTEEEILLEKYEEMKRALEILLGGELNELS